MEQATTAQLNAAHLREKITVRGPDGNLLVEGILVDIKPDYLELEGDGKDFPLLQAQKDANLSFQVNDKQGVPFFGIGQLMVATPKHIRISEYTLVSVSERREAFRVRAQLNGKVTVMATNARGIPIARTAPIVIRDLSPTGLFFLMSVGRLEVGQQVGVQLLLRYDHFDFTCRVRRLVEQDGQMGYGCSFEELTPALSDKLCAFLFRLQAEELRKVRKTRQSAE